MARRNSVAFGDAKIVGMSRTPNDIDHLIGQMTLDEKARLTSGASLWSTVDIERVGIPSIIVTDGPAGARGPFTPGLGKQSASLCVPCGSALGATFDAELLERIGAAVGHQARSKTARVLLAPTVNLHRSPLAGRNFECYSEDPLLSGKLAAAYIRGVQSNGVATTVKHFVGNDAEFERMTIDSVIDERTLREVYLVPFEHAVREGGSLGIMTSYNRLNGRYNAENRWLLHDLLRGEWGFEGFVITDWYAGFTTEGAAEAGLDLEMPAPARYYGKHLVDAVRDGRVDESQVDRAVRTLLTVFDRLGALDDEPAEPTAIDLDEHRTLVRRASAASMVLLRNEKIANDAPLLPLDPRSLRRLAVIGPNAARARIMGGGSAEVMPHPHLTIIEALRSRFAGVEVNHEHGCSIDRSTPTIAGDMVTSPNGEQGFTVTIVDKGRDVATIQRPDGRVLVVARQEEGVPISGFSFSAIGHLQVDATADYTISVSETSPCRLFLDDECIIDGTELPPPGHRFFGLFREEIATTVRLTKGRVHVLRLECDAVSRQWAHGAQIGLARVDDTDPIAAAVELARSSDVALVVVGTNNEWESEGHDRDTLDLPGRQVELIRRVAAANPRTVVLVNTGAPIDMEWVESVPAVMQVWFGGQEMGPAVADVLSGDAEPGGRLPTTIPVRIEHTPAFGNFPGEHHQIRYGEGVYIGHRWYDSRHLPVAFPFGFGLSYTTFRVGEPELDRYEMAGSDSVTLRVPVTNTGSRAGSHVVQIYVAPPKSAIARPVHELKTFAKVHLAPGETQVVELPLGPRAFAHWDPGDSYANPLRPHPTGLSTSVEIGRAGDWKVEPGVYEIRVASSSRHIDATALLTITS